MESERALLPQSVLDGLCGGHATSVSFSGIGKVNAACAAQRLILEQSPDAIINVGLAGHIPGGLSWGDVVIGRQCAYCDAWCGEEMGRMDGCPARFDSDPALCAAFESAAGGLEPACRIVPGLVSSGDQFYIRPEEDARIKRLYPDVLACDMESAAIAQVCLKYGVPFLPLKIISDVHSVAQAEQYTGFWEGCKPQIETLKSLLEAALL